MDKLRILFEKTGRAVYISHLDLMQTMQRAFSRAALPLKYSEGFNPHPQIAIALPLSVGMESLCELMDFRLDCETELSELPERLTAVLPEGIVVKEAYEAVRKPAEIKWIKCKTKFEYDERSAEDLLAPLKEFYARDEIVITKKTKRGIGPADIKPGLRSIKLSTNRSAVLVEAYVSAQEPTLNPDYLAEALRQLAPELAPDFHKFRRIELYDAKMQIFR